MESRKHIAKETILILGPQGVGNECMANMLDAHPELHVPGRAEGQSETGKFHFGYRNELGGVKLRWQPPKYNAGEHVRQVQHEVAVASQQIVHRTLEPPLIIGSHQFWTYTADIFTDLKIIVILPRYSSSNKKHLLANYMAKNYERDKSGPDAFMNGLTRYYEALPALQKHNVCYIMFEDFFIYKWHHEYLHVAEFLNLKPHCEAYFDIIKRIKNYG